ncbi:MAG TPA: hypothetical protein VIY49_36855 [Bryobacteraceae bacterium]
MKPQSKTILLTVNVEGKGTLSGVELYGTDRIIPELQNDVQALLQAPSCLGCIEASPLSEYQFQAANGQGWQLCAGQSIRGTKLSQVTGQSVVPDLRGVFLRGKNYGQKPGVEEVDLGQYRPDTVGPHQHKVMVPGNEQDEVGIKYEWGHIKIEKDKLVRALDDFTETQPKNVTVNYFCKVN